MSAYCQSCGAERSACTCRRRRSIFLETLGFTDAPPRPPRAVHRAAARATPVTTVTSNATPTRSTTGLVNELWAEEGPAEPFPPPIAPAIAQRSRGGWIRVVTTILILAAITAGAWFGTTFWLDSLAETQVAAASEAITTATGTADEIAGAVAAVTDPEADAIALSAATTVVSRLEDDTGRFSALATRPPLWTDHVGIELPDPLDGRRGAFGVVAEAGDDLATQLSRALTARLLVERLPGLPDLPSGADATTVAGLESELTALVAEWRAATGRLPDGLANQLAPIVADLEASSSQYLAMLASHDPDAERLADDLAATHTRLLPTALTWLESQGPQLTEAADRYRATLRSMG